MQEGKSTEVSVISKVEFPSELNMYPGCHKLLPVGWGLGSLEALWDQPGHVPTPQPGERQLGGTGTLGTSLGAGHRWARTWVTEGWPCCIIARGGLMASGSEMGSLAIDSVRNRGTGTVGPAMPWGPWQTDSPNHSHKASSEQRQYLRKYNTSRKLWATYFLFLKH